MKKFLLIILHIFLFSDISFAQKEKYESLFIYNFTKYIKWPDGYNPGNFVIGVIGNSSIFESLDEMATTKKKTSSGANLVVVKYQSVDAIENCNILFVSSNVLDKLAEIENHTSDKPILIVTDTPGMATKGAVINFIEQDGKIKFELNEAKARERKLVISGSLTTLAILI